MARIATPLVAFDGSIGADAGFQSRAWSANALVHIRRRMEIVCAGNAGIVLINGADFVRVSASDANGFDATILLVGSACIVSLGDWYDEFESVDLALHYMELAVAGALRLKIERIGLRPRRWVVERKQVDETWVEAGMMDVPLFLRYGTRTTAYLQNDFAAASHHRPTASC